VPITTTKLLDLSLTEITIDAPLDHHHPEAGTIEVFARVLTAEGGQNLPYLVFLQGGPGFEAPRPAPAAPPWVERALKDFQVVMLDQRGTGNSSPVGGVVVRDGERITSGLRAPLAGLSASDQAEYLSHFRADEIVNDAELIRQALGAQKWTLLGQSFGGFTSLHYLSVHPESLAGAIITGGLSAVQHPIDDVYSTTWQIMIAKSEDYYRRFPGDRERIVELTRLCEQGRITLPNGDRVSAERFRTVGHHLGMQDGAAELHQLLSLPHDSTAFAHDLAESLPFGGRNPIYAALHESSYADGVVTDWSAERTMPDRVREDPTLLAGEHIHRSVFSEDVELSAFADVADLLAQRQWNQLYFPDKLAQADVPVAASVYYGDAYVPLGFSMETAALLPDCRTWVTSQYEHNGLRMGTDVIDHLIGLLKGRRWL
jgi:Predicted hydrolases or acyltransferases (alpha/beta hydrolase superfamily)